MNIKRGSLKYFKFISSYISLNLLLSFESFSKKYSSIWAYIFSSSPSLYKGSSNILNLVPDKYSFILNGVKNLLFPKSINNLYFKSLFCSLLKATSTQLSSLNFIFFSPSLNFLVSTFIIFLKETVFVSRSSPKFLYSFILDLNKLLLTRLF